MRLKLKKNWGVREGDFLFCEGVWVGVSEILRFALDDMMSCADFF